MRVMQALKGIHHVTAITGDAQKNVNFYSGLLGLKLVKKTVNFDDPNSYHLYYGDHAGSPGTLVTFFAWPGAAPGKAGSGEPTAMAFAVPGNSLDWWKNRFDSFGTGFENGTRFGEPYLSVADADGMKIELIERPIGSGHGIERIHSVTLALQDPERSGGLYTKDIQFTLTGEDARRKRYSLGDGYVDVIGDSGPRGRMGAGTIHHVAFRTEDDASQKDWLAFIEKLGLSVSPVMDRKYFHSIYFREPGGVLFEIATDPPGMAVDEPETKLGEKLMLPAEYERWRSQLEHTLPVLVVPAGEAVSEFAT